MYIYIYVYIIQSISTYIHITQSTYACTECIYTSLYRIHMHVLSTRICTPYLASSQSCCHLHVCIHVYTECTFVLRIYIHALFTRTPHLASHHRSPLMCICVYTYIHDMRTRIFRNIYMLYLHAPSRLAWRLRGLRNR